MGTENPGRDLAPVPLHQQLELAKVMAESSLLPKQYQRQPGNMLYAIKYAESLGLSVIDAVTGIHVIEGKPSASANLIAALVRRAGHKLRVTVSPDGQAATASIIRCDDPDFTFTCTWTMERAKAAGLTNKSVWKSYPQAMLKARAITEVAREAASEALCGVIYTAEELGADGTVSEAGDFEPATATVITPAVAAGPGEIARGDAVQRLLLACGGNVADAQAAWADAGLPGKETPFVSLAAVEAVIAALPVDADVVEPDVFTDPAEAVDSYPQDPWALDEAEVA